MANPMHAADYVSLQVVSKEHTEERYVRARGTKAEYRRLRFPSTHVRLEQRGIARVYTGARRLVRLLVVALYCFPVLLIPKLVLRLAGSWYGDLITVGFVLLVCAVFGSLSFLALLHLLAGSRSERAKQGHLALRLPDATQPEDAARALSLPDPIPLLPSGEPPAGGSLRLRGRIDAGLSTGAPVLCDRWLEHEGRIVRAFSGSSFALRSDGAPPVLVELDGAPTLLGPYDNDAFDGAPPREPWELLIADLEERTVVAAPDLAGSETCILRQGDEIEVVASRWESVDAAELRIADRPLAEGGPYRGERVRGLVVRCLGDEGPVLVGRAVA